MLLLMFGASIYLNSGKVHAQTAAPAASVAPAAPAAPAAAAPAASAAAVPAASLLLLMLPQLHAAQPAVCQSDQYHVGAGNSVPGVLHASGIHVP